MQFPDTDKSVYPFYRVLSKVPVEVTFITDPPLGSWFHTSRIKILVMFEPSCPVTGNLTNNHIQSLFPPVYSCTRY